MDTRDIKNVRQSRATAGLLLMTLLGLSACSTPLGGPDYTRPDLPDKANWSQLDGREISASEIIHPEWWQQFGDPFLDNLIDQALDQSLTLSLASLRLERAGIELKDRRRSLFPDYSLNPEARVRGGKQQTTQDSNDISAGITWEIDIWGKIRKDVNATAANYRSNEMLWRGTYLKLVSDVASRYFNIRQFDEQIAHQTSSLRNSESLLQIYEQQYAEGMVPRTRILNQKSEISSLTSQLRELQRGREESELKLATLLGIPAGQFRVPQGNLESLSLIDVPVVLPADILSQRPDVLAAEFNVLRTHELLGKARLARLPTLNLVSNFNLAELATTTWTWGLSTSFKGMFDRDVYINIDSSEVSLKTAVEEYRVSVLTAFEEVEIALLNLRTRKEQMKLLEAQIADLTTVRDVNLQRLRAGLISQLEMFETERTLLSAQQGLLAAYQQVLTDTVILYIALGGGWPQEVVSEQSVASNNT
ncbi:MAG: efflux transporter outer membrane subunit [Pseudomonadota bacterium]